ncbi:MAG TPA: hypothetical protein VL225_05765 [Vicinamibacterales bacterium]|jgi:hypothetical protein|nr:hypothetical protein [Vicinamibacterales bacterium]
MPRQSGCHQPRGVAGMKSGVEDRAKVRAQLRERRKVREIAQ